MNQEANRAETGNATEWKNVLLPAYEVRKRKAQKTAFIDMLREHFGDRLRVERCGSLVKSRNIVIGDPDTADVIYTAHYDTCARLPFPNFITPRNLPLYILYQAAIALVFIIPLFALEALVFRLTRDLPELPSLLITEGVLILGIVGMFWVLMGDHPNPHTANDNTSGVAVVLTLADRLAGENAAFILFDNEENGLLGSMGYASAHPDIRKNRLIVNFDCVSDGANLLVLFSKKAEALPYYKVLCEGAERTFGGLSRTCEVCRKKGTIYPSDQANFQVSAAVCALNRSRHGILYMDKIHTPKDTVFEDENLYALTELFSDPALIGSFHEAESAQTPGV